MHPLIAIAQKSGPLRIALKKILGDLLVEAEASENSVVGLAISISSDGTDWPDHAAEIFNRHPNCVGLVVAAPDDPEDPKRKWPNLRSGLGHSFRACVHFISTSDTDLLSRILCQADKLHRHPPSASAMSRAREVIFAKALHSRLIEFSHGGRDDISNQFLAPLRLLLGGTNKVNLAERWTAESTALITRFNDRVIVNCNFDWWLTNELKLAFEEMGAEPWNPKPSGKHKTVEAIEAVMDLLTECRVLAGMSSLPLNGASNKVKSLNTNLSQKAWAYEILVIDDHSEAWRPVFEKVQREMRKGKDGIGVTFEFLTGGEHDTAEKNLKSLHEKLPKYDAVLLDVMLGPKLDGLAILREVRRHHLNCPIIIWTTSRAPELAAEAQLAHGFLFKKTVTLQEMSDLLKQQLRSGNARRRFPLPGHFFDHSILRRTNRKTAQRFAEYCSKQLDSFHALDERYFRFFTDHGGRHLLKLLEYVEAFIRPLIRNPNVFSPEDDAEREEEILSLYLAIFLHEFGMLRLRGKTEPDWNAMHPDEAARENQLVRSLHALRGMVMIADPSLSHWPDEEGQYQAGMRLHGKGTEALVASVAMITGYHSRLLPLAVQPREFCKWSDSIRKEMGKKAATELPSASRLGQEEKAQAGLKRISSRFFGQVRVKSTLGWCRKNIPKERLPRLMRHCALFRFADAIDVDHTRNPADFLALSSSVSPIDLREALKRQVIRQVHIDGGNVSFFSCVPKPELETVKKVLGEGISISNNPWDGEWTIKRIKAVKEHQNKLDKWLADFWENPLCVARKMGWKPQSNNRLTIDLKIAIASLTALSVALEVADEYEAIVQCELHEVIRLSLFDWREDCPVKKRKAMLSMLFHPNGLDRVCKQPYVVHSTPCGGL